jgi:hypothetical protein
MTIDAFLAFAYRSSFSGSRAYFPLGHEVIMHEQPPPDK